MKTSARGSIQQIRGVKTIDFAGHKEKVFGTNLRNEMAKCKLTW